MTPRALLLTLLIAGFFQIQAFAQFDLKSQAGSTYSRFEKTLQSLQAKPACTNTSGAPQVYNLHTDSIPPANGRTRICTMTLNSPAEKAAFLDHSKKTSDGSDYIELAPPGSSPSRNDWLVDTCRLLSQKKVACDELILSSHFGPRLYGDSRKEIDLDVLEKMSCDGVCPNLFNQLKKTYLFACNTLSGNTDDHRVASDQTGLSPKEKASSQQNYVVIQMAHDASRSWAEEASESRYGKYGDGGSFGGRFLRVFSNTVPGSEIYGFTTVDDKGVDNARYIKEAFAKHEPLETVMKSENMIKKPGTLDADSSHVKQVFCQLSKYDQNPDAVVGNIVNVYLNHDPDKRTFYPKMIQYLMNHYTRNHTPTDDDLELPDITSQPWAKTLAANADLKSFVLQGLREEVFPSSTRMQWSTFAFKLGWISKADLDRNLSQGLFGLMRPPYNDETHDDVLHFAKIYPESVSALNASQMPAVLKTNPSASSEAKSLLGEIDSLPPSGRLDPKIRNWTESQ